MKAQRGLWRGNWQENRGNRAHRGHLVRGLGAKDLPALEDEHLIVELHAQTPRQCEQALIKSVARAEACVRSGGLLLVA